MKFLFTTVLLSLSFIGICQDLSGTWEGKYVDDAKPQVDRYRFKCRLTIRKSSEGVYAGILSLKYTGINSVRSGGLNASYLVVIKQSGKEVFIEDQFKISSGGKGELPPHVSGTAILSSEKEMKGRLRGPTLYLPASGDLELEKSAEKIDEEDLVILDKYSKPDVEFGGYSYRAVKKTTISDYLYVSSEKEPLGYNETGMIVFKVYVKSPQATTLSYRLKALTDVSFIFRQAGSDEKPKLGSRLQEESEETMGIYKSASQTEAIGSIPIYTDFTTAADSVKFELTIFESTSKTKLLTQIMGFKTNPLLHGNFVEENSISPRTKLLDAYFSSGAGYTASSFSGLPESDTIATMWKAYFSKTGTAGFTRDAERSLLLAEQATSYVEAMAKRGSLECLFLYSLNLANRVSDKYNIQPLFQVLKYASDNGYGPAMIELGNYYIRKGNGSAALLALNKAYTKGLLKAAIPMANVYGSRNLGHLDIEKAKSLYKSLVDKGDSEARLWLARLYFQNSNPDEILSGISILEKSSKEGHLPSMVDLGAFYLNNRKNQEDYLGKAIEMLTMAASKGSSDGQFLLGTIYLSDNISLKLKDPVKGLNWIKKAAELGHPSSMHILGLAYQEGNHIEKNTIKSRYWINKAFLNGVGSGNKNLTTDNPFFNFIQELDFSPRREVTVIDASTGNEIQRYSEGPTGVELFGEAWIKAQQKSRVQTQEIVDGLEFIQEKDGVDIYAGVVSSQTLTGLSVEKNQKIEFIAYGKIQFGNLAGTRYPTGEKTSTVTDGLVNDIVRDDFASYNIARGIRHGAFIARIGEGDWMFIGSRRAIFASQDGPLTIAVNDRDYEGNKGYYDIEVKVYPKK